MAQSSAAREQSRDYSKCVKNDYDSYRDVEGEMTESYRYTGQRSGAGQENDDEITIDLSEVWNLARKNIGKLIGMIALFGVAAALITLFLIPKTYDSTAVLYLTPMVSNEGTVDYSSLQTNTKLVNNVMALLQQDNIMDYVAKENGFEDADAVRDVLEITNESNTELIDIKATTKDPKLSQAVAEGTAEYFIDTMSKSLNVRNIEVVTHAKVAKKQSGPSLGKNTIIGLVIGFAIDLAWVFIKTLTDKRIKSKQEAEEFFGVPVLCQLPVLDGNAKKNRRK